MLFYLGVINLTLSNILIFKLNCHSLEVNIDRKGQKFLKFILSKSYLHRTLIEDLIHVKVIKMSEHTQQEQEFVKQQS